MKKINWQRIIISSIVLYVLIWVAFCGFAANQSRNNYWLVEKEFNPTSSPLAHLSDDDWPVIISKQRFFSISPNERINIADKNFEKIKDIADEMGYDLPSLRKWYEKTAREFANYPIKTFRTSVFGKEIVQGEYRDLSGSGFPKPSVIRVFWRYLFSRDSLLFTFTIFPFVAIPILIIFGIIAGIISKNLMFRWKILFVVLVLVVIFEGWLISVAQKQPVSLGTYHFFDNGDFVSAEGTWTSDTKLGIPLQTTKLDCWQNWNHCIESTAEVFNGYLSVRTSYWEVENWGQNEIIFKENNIPACVNERLHIDRKNKIVTYTRATKQPKPDDCAGISDEPIICYLADGIKVQMKK